MAGNREPMLDLFIFETIQHIEKLEQSVLISEQADDMQTSINEIFRIMHTIKGNAAMMLFNNISELAHAMEDMFDYLRETKCWTKEGFDYSVIIDLVLEGIDFIKEEVRKIGNNQCADGESSGLIDRIRKHLCSIKDLNGKSNDCCEESEKSKGKKMRFYISSKQDDITCGLHNYEATIYFEAGCEMEDIRAFTLLHNVKEISSSVKYLPEDLLENSQSKEIIREQGFKLHIQTGLNEDEIYDFIQKTPFVNKIELCSKDRAPKAKRIILDESELEDQAFTEGEALTEENAKAAAIDTGVMLKERLNDESSSEAGAPTEIKTAAEAKVASSGTQVTGSSMISVSVSKLDKLMDLVGELVISEAMVTRNPELENMQLDSFLKAARQLRKITVELQDIAMSIRMVSLAPTFQKMNRLIRDMSKKVNKQVNLELIGQDTEVDKNIIENICDPLMHLIRNAIDHGIESSDERVQKGKTVQGNITLEAHNAGGDVLIVVRDDGKGLNRDKIYNKALENGLTSKKEEELSDREIFSFIFLPGFSTKEKVTEFSGRGVGMDVVQKNIEKVRGTIQIDSKPGMGTVISIKIPLTLSIIDGMTIRVGSSRYTIPITSIRESLRINNDDVINDLDGNEMIILRGESCPIVRLHKLYKLRTETVDLNKGIIIVVESEGKSICLFADELLGEQQVVVKTLPSYIKKVKGVAGCTILGDGGISLILNVQELVSR